MVWGGSVCFIPVTLLYCCMTFDIKFEPLSERSSSGTPIRTVTSAKKLKTVSVVTFRKAKASGHLVEYSIRTNMYLFPVLVLDKGPNTSIATLANGSFMTDKGWRGALVVTAGPAFWQMRHEAHNSFTSLATPGQSIRALMACNIRSLVKCPCLGSFFGLPLVPQLNFCLMYGMVSSSKFCCSKNKAHSP